MKKFASKPGLELLVPLSLLLGYALFGAIMDQNWIAVLLLALVVVFFLYLYNTTRYNIYGKQLEVSCGFFYYKMVQIDTISSIKKVTDVFAAPATSIYRLLITYNNKECVAISPMHKLDFIQTLTNINPAIRIE